MSGRPAVLLEATWGLATQAVVQTGHPKGDFLTSCHCCTIAATFSIVGRDARNGYLGSAVASRYLAVGAVVPFLRAGVGVINTQHWSDPDLAARGLALLASGLDPETTLRMMLAGDERPQSRQLLVLDARGRVAVHTGEDCEKPRKAAIGEDCAAGGNMLTSEAVIDAMIEAFVRGAEKPLGLRLLLSLQAGQEAGGDYRGKQAAAVRTVCPPEVAWSQACVDLRVDDHPEPIAELLRLYALCPEPSAEEGVAADGEPIQDQRGTARGSSSTATRKRRGPFALAVPDP